MKKILTILSLLLVGTIGAQTFDTLNYNHDGKALRGFVAKPAKINKKTKTILIVHEWWGLNEYVKNRAKQLANEGFIAVCVDMYGAGVTADNPQDAGALAGQFYADNNLMYNRFLAGYNAALNVAGVNKEKMAAIGYCFGGTVVLNSAKMGAKLDAVVSFHGGLQGPVINKDLLTASVLVCHGAADKFVPQTDVDSLASDMKRNGEDYTFISYPDATHAFTNPDATAAGQKFSIPIAYNEAADKKSYTDFIEFINKKVK